jgi:predicted secreted protein
MKPLIGGLFLLAATTQANAQKKLGALISLDSAFQQVEVKKNASFGVLVQVQSGTGYNWDLATPPAKCRFTESKITEAATLPGAKETRLMVFKATESGLDSIRFVYRRAWETDSKPQSERVLAVTIQ